MKPRNFPGNRNARRLAAMDRLPKGSAEYEKTKANLVEGARDLRTKIRRGVGK